MHFADNAPPTLPTDEERRSRKLAADEYADTVAADPLVEDGRVLTVDEATEMYMKVNYTNQKHERNMSHYEKARYETYPKILEGERQLIERYDGLTTAMLVRRISPFDDDGELLRPLAIDEMLNAEGIRRAVRRALDYHLDDWSFEWCAVVTPNASLGTPREIIYLWIDDPDDEVGLRQVEPALEKHVEMCPNTSPAMHEYSRSGTAGVLQVRNDPETASKENVPERFADHPPTTGALHVATKLPHLAGGQPNSPDTLTEGAVLAWASPRNWVRFSGGFPDLR